MPTAKIIVFKRFIYRTIVTCFETEGDVRLDIHCKQRNIFRAHLLPLLCPYFIS